jgi:uncharacterized integral membrane protein (TIGR00698 family)
MQKKFPIASWRDVIFILGFVVALSGVLNSGLCLLLGVVLALADCNPYTAWSKKMTKPLLAYAIVALGFGMNLGVVGRAGLNGVVNTLIGLSLTLSFGYLVGRFLKINSVVSLLISVGTAICGGSAIAAVSSAIHAKDDETSVSLGIVFVLNAVALLIFPAIGHYFHLTQEQFGMWSALAIHDTSSVVGATSQYGLQALQIGTTVKLTRALWIIPVTLVLGRFWNQDASRPTSRPPFPNFIFGFLAASALVTLVPSLEGIGHGIENAGRHLLAATLFLIGANLSRKTLQTLGVNPLIMGFVLWIVVATTCLTCIMWLS